MSTLGKRTTKAVALVLMLAVTQVYVHADLMRAATARVLAATAPAQAQGRLTTRNNNPVTLNGNEARTGETLFSGQQIQTPAGTGATADLGPLGQVLLSPNTEAALTFEAGRIHVRLVRGCVIASPSGGANATVEAQGTTIGPRGEQIDVCTSNTGAAPIVGQGAAAAAGAGAGTGAVTAAVVGTTAATTGGAGTGAVVAGAIGFGALVTAAIVVPCRRGRNPSPGTPRGRNDECRD